MFITPNLVVGSLERRNVRAVVVNDHLVGNCLRLWPPAPPRKRVLPLYTVTAEQAQRLSEEEVAGCALLVASPTWPPRLGTAAAARTVAACLFRGDDRAFHALVAEALEELNYGLSRLGDEVYESLGIQELVDDARQVLLAPFVVCDLDFLPLAQSADAPDAPTPLMRELLSGTARERFAHELAGITEYFAHSNIPYELPLGGGSCLLFCSVFRQDGACGYLVADVSEAAIGYVRDIATQIAAKLGTALLFDELEGTFVESRAQRLLQRVLDGSPEAAQALRSIFDAEEGTSATHFQLASLVGVGDAGSVSFLRMLARQLRAYDPTPLVTVHQMQIVCLYRADHEMVMGPEQERRIGHFAQANNLHAGLSRSLTSLEDGARMLEQSLAAIELGLQQHPGRWVFRFSDYAYSYLKDVLQARAPLETYCHPGVLALVEHDEQHGSQLVQTVSCYLECDKSPSQTARRLSIHRSTLDYRIRKAEEVMGTSLQDADGRFAIWFSLRLLGYGSPGR